MYLAKLPLPIFSEPNRLKQYPTLAELWRTSPELKKKHLAAAIASPAGFAFLANNGRYILAPHVLGLNEILLLAAGGYYNRIIISEPPRHGKSELTSRCFPPWLLMHYPDKRFILASYEASFASQWGRKARDIFGVWAPKLRGLHLDPKVRSEDDWGIAGHSGGMQTAGVGSGVTGKGADFFLIDDPIKDAAQARSQTYRENAWDWFTAVAYTRLEPGAVMIIIMTRWHEDDIVGRLLARQDEFNERWAYFNLPAVAGSDDLLGREEGAALWPARYNKDRLDTIRAVMGEYWFSAQFQGNPIPDGGSIFKQSEFAYCSMDQTYIHLYQWDGLTRVYERKKCLVFQTADFSLKTKQQNDYSVISTWVKTPDNDLCLVDVFREKVETTRHVSSTRNQFDKWNPGFIVVEEQAGGLNVVNELKKEGVPIVGVPSTVDKVDRARTAAARFQVNKVFFLRGTPFLADVEHELVGFPNGQHDDIVDTISAAAIKLLDMRGGMVEIITGNTKRDTTEVVNNGFQESEKQKRFTIKKRPEGSRQTSRRNFIPGG